MAPQVLFAAAQEDSLARRRTPIVVAYERARDSVVNISTTQIIEQRRFGFDVFGFPQLFNVPTERSSVGSGFVIHEDGYIATNAHVVAAGAQLTVSFADGTEYEANIIGGDSTRDLAIIKVNPERPLKPIAMGRSDDLMIGEQTIAIGNPVGLQNTVTTGVVSALHRELTVNGRTVYRDVIQTDASINPGNSGGPLLNILGELIGINTAIRGDAQNIGFAIPVDQLKEMLPEILDSEKLKNIHVGMRLGEDTPPRVEFIDGGSPADEANVELGDVLESVDGRPVRQPVDFYVAMLERKPGDTVRLQLRHNGAAKEARVKLAPVPKPDGREIALRRLGLTITDVGDKAAKSVQWRRHGVIVVGVEPNSPAALEGIQPGDVIVAMGRYHIEDVDHVGTLLQGISPGSPVDVVFRRIKRSKLAEYPVRLYAR